ncbi:hypothetical protein LTR70_001487 [Exophiala xenobiotica]|uniref:Uncharacterized protein n=1 Tax=Lithohypha guttulata TaxID=1690604 RepID=A0ABR0KH64_9EURO|nr:hypothetical protein LTR24_002777 [Lithohypha guttulata]KAK5327864.1 hypothetical protein LTR70_001487 [Exophiala xenobiotica]
MSDKTPKSQSPSGAEPHNDYGVKDSSQKSDPTPTSDSQDIDPRSQSPSGAEPHNSYGTAESGSGGDSAPEAPNTKDAFKEEISQGTDKKRADSGRSKL